MIEPNKQEQAALKAISQGSVGFHLISYLTKLTDSLCDVRKTPKMNDEQRIAVSKLIEDNLINKLKVIRGEIKPDDDEEDYE